MKAVFAEKLVKVYPNGKHALAGVDFSIDEGQIFGFLGPNGAGKTTAVKILTGMLRPTEGSCGVFGLDPAVSPEKVHALSGVVTEHAQMYNNMSGLENLLFFAAVFGMDKDEGKKRAGELLERLSLVEARDQKLGGYSTGMRQRLSLARAMIHRPKALFLDEPTSGLDPASAKSVNELIKILAAEHGTTVFLCTHQLRYAEEICDTYGLIGEGAILASGSLDELRRLVSPGMTVRLRSSSYPPELNFRRDGEYILVDVNSADAIPPLVKRIIDSGGSVDHVSSRRASLEEMYFALIERREKTESKNA